MSTLFRTLDAWWAPERRLGNAR